MLSGKKICGEEEARHSAKKKKKLQYSLKNSYLSVKTLGVHPPNLLPHVNTVVLLTDEATRKQRRPETT